MYLCDQRTGSIEHAQSSLRSLFPYRAGNAVCAENNCRAGWNLTEFVDKYRSLRAEIINHEPVVHHFVAHVDGRAEQFERTLDNFNGAVHARAETAGIG